MTVRGAILGLLFGCAAGLAGPAWAQDVVEPIAVDGAWRTLDSEAESPDALPPVDQWTPIDLMAAAGQPTGWTESPTVWLARDVDLPEAWSGRPVAVSMMVRGDTRVFANGQALTAIGTDDLEVGAGHWFFVLPTDAVSPVSLVLRNEVRASVVNYARDRVSPQSIFVGPAESLPSIERSRVRAEVLQGNLLQIITATLLLTGAIGCFAVFGLRRLTPFLWYGLMLATSGAWFVSGLWDAVAVLPGDVFLQVQLSTAHLAFAVSLKFYWDFLRTDPMGWLFRLGVAGPLVCATLYAVDIDLAQRLVGPPVHELVALGCQLMGTGLVFVESWRGSRPARIILVGVGPHAAVMVFQLLGQTGVGPGIPPWMLATANLGILAMMGVALIDLVQPRELVNGSQTSAGPATHAPPALAPMPVDALDGPSPTTAQLLALSTIGPSRAQGFTPIPGPDPRLEPQTRVGRYVLHECLGRGGMGEVYRARDPDLDRDVAIKLVSTSGDGSHGERHQALLLREAVAMARCVHANVVTIFDVGTHESEVFLAMEYLQGSTLAEWEEGADGPELVARYRDAGHGLAAAHRAGVVHGDFKPTNVMCTEDGRTVVVDFGIARAAAGTDAPAALDESRGIHLRGAGTPAYMAPELHDGGPSSAQSDQYAFAISLLHAIYRWPIGPVADTADRLRERIDSGEFEGSRTWTPSEELLDVLLRAMADRPENRFEGMGQLLGAIPNV